MYNLTMYNSIPLKSTRFKQPDQPWSIETCRPLFRLAWNRQSELLHWFMCSPFPFYLSLQCLVFQFRRKLDYIDLTCLFSWAVQSYSTLCAGLLGLLLCCPLSLLGLSHLLLTLKHPLPGSRTPWLPGSPVPLPSGATLSWRLSGGMWHPMDGTGRPACTSYSLDVERHSMSLLWHPDPALPNNRIGF